MIRGRIVVEIYDKSTQRDLLRKPDFYQTFELSKNQAQVLQNETKINSVNLKKKYISKDNTLVPNSYQDNV